jgi:simple sugar transport system permease protein
VYTLRYVNIIASGMLAGLGGAWFSLETVGAFDDMMTGGKGFIALAAMIFGKWRPGGAFGGALLFGFVDALQIKLQIAGVMIPYQFLSMAPYVVTMIVLAGWIGRAVPPAAVGRPYERNA